MLLQVVPEEGQDVLPEDIHYYDAPPFDDGNHLAHGVDLAISTKESADYPAIVSGEVTWPNGKLELTQKLARLTTMAQITISVLVVRLGSQAALWSKLDLAH